MEAALLAAGYLVARVRENGLPHLDIDNPDLFQIDYIYRHGSDEQLIEHVAPVAEHILAWARERAAVRAAHGE